MKVMMKISMDSTMKAVFIKEEKDYSLKDLLRLFDYDENKTKELLKKFKNYGILKVKSNKNKKTYNVLQEDSEIVNIDVDFDGKYSYKFTFVGIFIVPEIVLKCYPKYVDNDKNLLLQFKQVLQVIRKLNKKETFLKFQNMDLESDNFNLLEIILYLFSDYYEYGVYRNIQEEYEVNGIGEIQWDKTINDAFVLISDNRPFYPELITKKKIEDDYNFIKKLHQSILTQCSNELKYCGLLELFDIQEIRLSDEKISDLGEKEYILDMLEKEQRIQYNTRKVMLLKVMHNYIDNKYEFEDNSEFSFYGTNSFHVIWEKVCKEVLENKLEKYIKDINLPKNMHGTKKLKEIVEKPKWHIYNKDIFTKPFELDIISIYKDKNNQFRFIIFDAKYHVLKISEEKGKFIIKGQPKLEEITKQYMYQLNYKKFLKECNFKEDSIRNCFVLPTEKEKIENLGIVTINILENLGLENIQVIQLPAHDMFKLYLEDNKFNINELNLFNK
ncbi:LlaJI family restriction endonuclease [Gemella morbillorum]|uniref:LlaJI family restriction endonuclease n=1 Tax=Gemella morbillorum TaxID=29391 RepID=UPI0028D81DF3|nr:LlaJI family restriction endonuclease [Gemella morbillorum]